MIQQSDTIQKRRLRDRERNKRIKRQVIEHYGSICACCGESHIEFLAIDHIHGNGNISRRNNSKGGSGGVPYYQKLIREEYPEGYRVLCHNCNMSYGAYGYCIHDIERGDIILDQYGKPIKVIKEIYV